MPHLRYGPSSTQTVEQEFCFVYFFSVKLQKNFLVFKAFTPLIDIISRRVEGASSRRNFVIQEYAMGAIWSLLQSNCIPLHLLYSILLAQAQSLITDQMDIICSHLYSEWDLLVINTVKVVWAASERNGTLSPFVSLIQIHSYKSIESCSIHWPIDSPLIFRKYQS
jgi:hypothetical protein